MNVYLDQQEQKLLQQLASQIQISQSFLLRLIFRQAVGLPTENTARVNPDIHSYVRNLTGMR